MFDVRKRARKFLFSSEKSHEKFSVKALAVPLKHRDEKHRKTFIADQVERVWNCCSRFIHLKFKWERSKCWYANVEENLIESFLWNVHIWDCGELCSSSSVSVWVRRKALASHKLDRCPMGVVPAFHLHNVQSLLPMLLVNHVKLSEQMWKNLPRFLANVTIYDPQFFSRAFERNGECSEIDIMQIPLCFLALLNHLRPVSVYGIDFQCFLFLWKRKIYQQFFSWLRW